jgi:putative N6-adenine-specific DNA methylase
VELVATCALGLEEPLDAELAALRVEERARTRAAVGFRGGWPEVWRANLRLRTANRVLVELASWPARDGDELLAGARHLVRSGAPLAGGLDAAALFDPGRSFAIEATASRSAVRDARWAALKTKDGIVDGQRDRFGRRASVAPRDPDLALRLRLHADRATLLLDTSGAPLDQRGYRVATTLAPVRETLAAACVLVSGWDGRGPVVDPMCGSGTLLVEAAWLALGRPPGWLRPSWAFERLPGFEARAFAAVRAETLPAPGPEVRLVGNDRSAEALRAARANLERAGVLDRARLRRGEADALEPPAGPGLLVVNPPYGERAAAASGQWRALGDLLKRRYAGWRAVVLAGGEGLGKEIGLRPRRRWPVMNGPLQARLLVFELY